MCDILKSLAVAKKEVAALKISFYEGYIRNQKNLCEQLRLSAESSRNKTERKLLLTAYKRWGYDMAAHFEGSFAFAIWDEEKREMFCARDPFGIQTFYYHLTSEGEFLCSGNVREIVETKGFQKAIDPQALQYYFMFGYPVGEKTIYKSVLKLLPGRTLIFREGQCKINRYFKPEFQPEIGVSEIEWEERIRQTLKTVLDEDRENFDFSRAQCFLSGGVDSSFLLAASGVKNAGNIGFDDKEMSEYAFAQETAAFLGADLHPITITAEEYFGAIPSFLKNVELPLSDPSAVAFAAGCKKTAERTTCCLSGEGADEFFAGYHIYRKAEELANVRYCGCFGVTDEEEARKLLRIDTFFPAEMLVQDIYEKENISDPLNRMLAVDIALWLEGDILLNVSKNTHACGINLLLPFADRRMFALSAQIPPTLKLKDSCGKYIFRKAASEVLPEETAFRAKAGFPVPVKKWILLQPYKSEVENTLFGEHASAFLNTHVLRKLWNAFCAGSMELFQVIFTTYIFLKWYEQIF